MILLDVFPKIMNVKTKNSNSFSPNHLRNHWHYKLVNFTVIQNNIFNRFEKCEEIFPNDLTVIPDDEKIRLLLWRLRATKHGRLICPRTTSDLKFHEIALILYDLYGDKSFALRNASNVLLSPKIMLKTGWPMPVVSILFWIFRVFRHFEGSFQMSTEFLVELSQNVSSL